MSESHLYLFIINSSNRQDIIIGFLSTAKLIKYSKKINNKQTKYDEFGKYDFLGSTYKVNKSKYKYRYRPTLAFF